MLTAVLFVVLVVLAFTPSIGFARPSIAKIPEWDIWDLNPVLWFPYYVAGHLRVGIDVFNDPYGRTLPPEAFMDLLVVTMLLWAAISLALNKVVALVSFRRRGPTKPLTPKSD
jgi:hypothetical protein